VAPHLLILILLQLLLGPPLDALVDRGHGLPAWYAPGPNAQAVRALDELQAAAWEDQIRLAVYSGYRSYAYQAKVIERAGRAGSAQPAAYLASPGHSEHQLGTAFDVVWPGLRVEMLDDRNLMLFAWLEQNAHRYGFVLSYPLKHTDTWPFSNRWLPGVTEYIYEPWHLRFVGRPLAGQIHDSGYLDPDSGVLPQDFYRPWP